jgi:transcriptional regulator with XRE-family HTH domain
VNIALRGKAYGKYGITMQVNVGPTSSREASPVAQNIGEAIREARLRLKLTQEETARRAKIAAPAFNRLELGRSDPKWSTVVRVAQALGMTLDELVEGYIDRAVLQQPPVSTADARGAIRAIKRDLDNATTRLVELEERYAATRKRT